LDSYCLPRLYSTHDALPDPRHFALWEITFAELSARQKAGFDQAAVREFLLARVQRAATPPKHTLAASSVTGEDVHEARE